MKQLSFLTLLLTLGLVIAPSVSAQASQEKKALKQEAKMEKKEKMQAIKQNQKDNRVEQRAKAKGNSTRAFVTNATLTAVSGSTMTVTKDSKSYTITTTSTTKFRRSYGGLTTIAEFSVGNKVDITGKWADTAKTSIAAATIRNRSIMKMRGTFIGEVTTKSGNSIVLKSKSRGNQMVTLTASTKYVGRNQKPISLADVAVGHKIRVKGMWDKTLNTVTEVTQVKDFNVPAKAVSVTPTVGASVSASPTEMMMSPTP